MNLTDANNRETPTCLLKKWLDCGMIWHSILLSSPKGNLYMKIRGRKPLPCHSSQKGCKEARSPWQTSNPKVQKGSKRSRRHGWINIYSINIGMRSCYKTTRQFKTMFWWFLYVWVVWIFSSAILDKKPEPRIDLSDESLYIICQGICTLDRSEAKHCTNNCQEKHPTTVTHWMVNLRWTRSCTQHGADVVAHIIVQSIARPRPVMLSDQILSMS